MKQLKMKQLQLKELKERIFVRQITNNIKSFTRALRPIVAAIANSSVFNSFIMFVIGVNAIIIGFETVDSWKVAHKELFRTLDHLFLAIYTIEFFIKLYADSRGYWRSAYNVFDFVILAMSFLQVIMRKLNVGDNILGVFRLLRALRTLRTISFIEGLQVLVTALIDTIRNSVLNVVILLALLMLFFGVVGYYIFGYDDNGDKLRWGTLDDAMLTLFAFVTADGWTDIQKRLATKFSGSQWFTVVFIFLGHFIFTNLFIGIIIMNIHEATERFLNAQQTEKEVQLKLKKEYLYKRQHDDVKQMQEKQKTSDYKNFQEMTKSFFETLRHDDYDITQDVCTNLVWMETYIDSLDFLDLYTHRVQQFHRNLVLVLSEMSERHIKKQYGLVLDDSSGSGHDFSLDKRKGEENKSENEDGLHCSNKQQLSRKPGLPQKRKLSFLAHPPSLTSVDIPHTSNNDISFIGNEHSSVSGNLWLPPGHPFLAKPSVPVKANVDTTDMTVRLDKIEEINEETNEESDEVKEG